MQLDALKREGCEKIFTEKISGASKHRPEYDKMREQLRPADEVIVWDIDRLGRTTLELIVLIDTWNQKGILFKSACKPLIDTTTPHGEFIFQLFAILSQHERKRLIRRPNAGLDAARARGRIGGRNKGLSARYEKVTPLILNAYKEGSTIRDIRQAVSIPSSATVYKILNTKNDLKSSSSKHILRKGKFLTLQY